MVWPLAGWEASVVVLAAVVVIVIPAARAAGEEHGGGGHRQRAAGDPEEGAAAGGRVHLGTSRRGGERRYPTPRRAGPDGWSGGGATSASCQTATPPAVAGGRPSSSGREPAINLRVGLRAGGTPAAPP